MLDTRHIPAVLPAPQLRVSAARRTVAGAPAAGLLAGLVVAPALLNPHWTFLAASMLVYALVLLSFVVLYGWLGQVSFVQAELMGIGAFTAATLTAGGTVPAWLAALIAMAVTVPTAMVVAIPSLRLRGFNVSLATLAFAVCLDNLILNTQTVSRLDIGQPSGRPAWGGNQLTDVQFYYLAAAIFGVAAIGIAWLRRSNLGRSFRAIKDSEVAAEASGLDVWKYKLIGWAISSALAGLGGALIAYLLGIVNFRPFSVTQSLFLFAVAVIGGTTGVAGALVGAMFFVFVPEMLSYVETTGKYTYLIDGAGVLLAVLFFPKGLAAVGGQVRTATQWVRRRRAAAEVT